MSGICGIVRFNEKPVKKEEIQKMLDTMRNCGNDTESIWVDRNAGFGHKMLWTTPESLHEMQPLVSEDDSLVLTADARIDNREELADKLGININDFNVITDADLILYAFKMWGEDCPKHLIGDFSFVIWDQNKKTLFCAIDHLGIKPFFYYSTDKFIVFASEISSLFSCGFIPKLVNKEALECSLLFDSIPYTHTYFKDIYCLRGGTYKVCKESICSDVAYWKPSDEQDIRDISFADASDELRMLYQQALQARLRSAYPIGFELSGGLDSSSAVSFANQIGSDQPQLLYSLRFEGLSCDEGKYIDVVSQVVKQQPKEIQAGELDYKDNESLTHFYERYPDWPMDLFFVPHLNLADLAAEDQCRTILTGQGGDEVLQGSRMMLADFLEHGQLIDLVSQLANSRYKKDDLLYFVIRPFVPERLKKIKRFFQKNDIKKKDILYRKYAQKIKFDYHFKLRSSTHSAKMIFGTEHALWFNMNGYNLYGNLDIEVRHPLFDIRLIKFRLTTPPEYFYSNSTFKYLFRDSMKGILPEIVRRREDKANFDDIVKIQLRAEIERNPAVSNIQDLKIRQEIGLEIWNILDTHHAKLGFRESEAFLKWKLLNLEYWYIRNFVV